MKASNIKIGVLHNKCTTNIHNFLRLNNPNIIAGYGAVDDLNKWYKRKEIKGVMYSPQSGEGVTQLKSFDEVINRVCEESDVIITWGLQCDLKELEKFAHKPIILSANGQCAWVRNYIANSEPYHNNFMAVSEMAKLTFSPEIRDKVEIVPDQIDTDIYRPLDKIECRKKLGLPVDAVIVGTFGRDIADKRYDRFVATMEMLPEYTSLIVGNDSLKHKANINIPFKYQSMEEYYNALDCYVSLSDREGDSNCIKEAMACKIPCVTTPVGSAIELSSKHNCQNIIIPPYYEPSLIARAIKHQVEQSDRESIYNIVRENYSNKERLFNHVISVYKKWHSIK